jgi:hypothetical protein
MNSKRIRHTHSSGGFLDELLMPTGVTPAIGTLGLLATSELAHGRKPHRTVVAGLKKVVKRTSNVTHSVASRGKKILKKTSNTTRSTGKKLLKKTTGVFKKKKPTRRSASQKGGGDILPGLLPGQLFDISGLTGQIPTGEESVVLKGGGGSSKSRGCDCKGKCSCKGRGNKRSTVKRGGSSLSNILLPTNSVGNALTVAGLVGISSHATKKCEHKAKKVLKKKVLKKKKPTRRKPGAK